MENDVEVEDQLDNYDIMEDFVELDGDDPAREFIDDFFNNPKNAILKTRLNNAHSMAALMMMQKKAKRLGLRKTSDTLFNFISDYIISLIPLNGLSREEFVEVAKAYLMMGNQEEQTLEEKHLSQGE